MQVGDGSLLAVLDATSCFPRTRTIVASGVPAERLRVELLDCDYPLIEPVVEARSSVALDLGHPVHDGLDELSTMRGLLPHTRVVQWHGTDVQKCVRRAW